jgi:hypothetical protein
MTIGTTVRRAGLAAIAVVLLAGCSSPQLDDSGDTAENVSDVTNTEVYRNIDKYPNVERFCVDGLAFAATSSTTKDGTAKAPVLLRMPEWDLSHCGTEHR